MALSEPDTAVAPMREAVLAGLRHTFGILFGTEPIVGPMERRGDGVPAESATAVAVGFTGEISGQILLAMPRETAMEMASSLLGEPLESLDMLGQSAIAEIANMTAGACATELRARGWSSTITVPTVITGERIEVTWPDLAVDEVEIMMPFGPLNFSVGLKIERA